ncbi:tRNA pseudouridine synthase B [Kushneria sinocarnis]|uniref:tRNA pseudouridine synthase B n=1 Tax=Kushneria sinocarnis TaxID=595502 RepID=A0A420WT55_9GAMM|nr:tRNA pseudouridine(55) synthase TruB [Kushneria sinocarnis]RKQ95804.1 tRNA pseudouridine synthase B [Kushneria sinocarnis]
MARRRRGRPLSGVLLFDKPAGMTSNHALQRVRRLFNAQKAGHTGTLDPMATGLLPICFGEATKFTAWLLDADKRYTAGVALGTTTDTGDREGAVLARAPVPALDEAALGDTLSRFTGEQWQLPPMYSALKHQGRPLYEYAREGVEIERARRQVSIYHVGLLARRELGFELDVRVSKGTYVRTLIEDIGAAIGCGAHLDALRRLATGPFDERQPMVTLDALEVMSEAERDARLLPSESLVAHLPVLEADPAGCRRLRNGQTIRLPTGELVVGSLAQLFGTPDDASGRTFLGLVRVTEAGQCAPQRLVATAAGQTGE